MSSRTVKAGRWFRGKLADAGFVPPVDPSTAIGNITVTGVYADDDDSIEAAINDILAALRSHKIIAE